MFLRGIHRPKRPAGTFSGRIRVGVGCIALALLAACGSAPLEERFYALSSEPAPAASATAPLSR